MIKSGMIGNKITEARKKVNLSQAQLAQSLFISPQAVGKWERGESMPDIITFNHLAEILGVDLNYFSEMFQPAAIEVTSGESLTKQPSETLTRQRKNKLSWDLSHENLADTDFSGLKNLYEKLGSSNLQHCLFIGSDMTGLLLKSNNVDSCDFSSSDLSSSHFHSSNLINNLFRDCFLKETEFSGSNIMGCDFSGSDFTSAAFKSGGFQNNQMARAVWNRTSFNDMWIIDIVFDGTLDDCYFENCIFKNVTFRNSTLINTFFKSNKRMKQVRFIDCKADKLTFAFLKNGKADLAGITLLT